MKLHEMIADLRGQGYVVQIEHHRCRNLDVDDALKRRPTDGALAHPALYFPQTQFPQEIPASEKTSMSAKAGKTVARIGRKDGDQVTVIASGEAVCSPLDAYVRHTGAIKALGRAVSNLLHDSIGRT